MNKNRLNPWAGLASYEDPETAERKLKFCGRDDDSYDVAKLIMGNIFVTLYGKSGIGKTSLLNAGVFPELREEQFTPLSLRLGMRDEEHPLSYQTIIVEAVERIVTRTETINVIDEQTNQEAVDYLWNYFARHRYFDKYDEQTTPVIVFDQFEEVFRTDRKEAEMLLRQLDYINDKDHTLDNCEVEGQSYRYEQNFRFVVSIREDDLYRLEDSIDNCYLPALKRCRYRLRSLSEEGARDAILIPGEGLFKPDEQEEIVNTIISIASNKEDHSISTNLLSLVCSRIFVDFQKSDADHITPAIVDSFVKGNPFERFYNEATRGFSNREKTYIEDRLVDSTGRRNSIPESDFLLHVKNGTKLLEGDAHILQRTSTSSDGSNYRIELIHDSFCEPLATQKEKREKRKLRWRIAVMSLLSIFIFGGAYLIIHNLKERQEKMLINQSRFIAEKISVLVDDGDSRTASLLALDALPKDLNHPDRPYTIEAEIALRKASMLQSVILLKGHTNTVNSAEFSPDGKHIVSASSDNTIRIWDAETEQLLQTLGHESECFFATYSPDGSRIVSTSWGNIRIMDAKSGQCLQTIKAQLSYRNSATFSPDGKLLVSTSRDSTIRVWDATNGQCLQTLKGHSSEVNSATFSPDNKCIVSASNDKTLRIWDTNTGQCLHIIEVLCDVHSATFSPDGNHIISADHGIHVWDVKTGSCVQTIGGNNNYYAAYYSLDGKYIVSANDYSIIIWNANTGECLQTIKVGIGFNRFVAFSPDGKRIVSTATDFDGTIRIWDVKTVIKKEKLLKGHTGRIEEANFSPDMKHIISASKDSTIRIWDVNTGKCLKTIKDHSGRVSSAAYSPDMKSIVSTSRDSTICIWDVNTGKCLWISEKYVNEVNHASYSPDGKHIVSVHGDSTIHICDTNTRKCLRILKDHTGYIYSAVFSPNGQRIASTSADGTIRIWDTYSGKCLRILKGHTAHVTSIVFSPDGQKIASKSFDHTVRIWDTESNQCILTIEDYCYRMNFCPDGKGLLWVSSEGIGIWNLASGQFIPIGKRDRDPFSFDFEDEQFITFSPDGKYIMLPTLSSKDNVIRIIDFPYPPLQELIDETRERFKDRQLTPEERRKYYLE